MEEFHNKQMLFHHSRTLNMFHTHQVHSA